MTAGSQWSAQSDKTLEQIMEELQREVGRPLSQTERVLRLLKRRGTFGASNRELNSICFRYSARIYDLRQDGHDIRGERDSAGLFRYILFGETD